MEPQYKSSAVNTPYDDVFRTMLNDCSSLIIPVINEVFSEQYTGEEEVILSPETHYINQQDGDEVKRITDGSFIIRGKEEKRFLCECQSTPDSSMLVRIFEYSTQIALDQGEIVGNVLKVEIPRSAVLFLRSPIHTATTRAGRKRRLDRSLTPSKIYAKWPSSFLMVWGAE